MQTENQIEEMVKDIIGSSVQECYNLYKAVHHVSPLNGEVVEIGCLYGRTSLPICLAAKETGKKSVHIDYLFQYPDLETCRLGGYDQYPSKENLEDAYSKSTYIEFTKNFIKNDLFENAIIIASKSQTAREIWEKDIKFLFIDADHSYEGVKKDFEDFEPFVVKNGLIAMHDIDPTGHPGVFKYFNEIMASRKYSIIHGGDGTSLRIIQKIKD